ncbi:xanthine dehydrogenase family protein subunit M [Amycolatopsis sp. cg5]|uniref:FAD binding domain-containing protein n=1 Tax=Amycolatopsis sp. cg5 TaxID=3238802 RepID=UPI0035234CF3
MHAYDFATARDIRQATSSTGAFLAGGTTLVDLMKLGVLRPDHVVDINSLPLRGIRTGRDGVRIGALERMSDLAADRTIAGHYPVFAQALAVSASPQIRNMASIGGNLLQRTRCGYFRDVTTPCNKRQPGSGCPARTGDNREHAILGTSTSCVATHASDAAVALMALDASVRLIGREGERTVRLAEFYRLPGATPDVENQLKPSELIAELILPRLDWARTSTYVKVRDRQSYEFALCSAAVALDVRGHRIRDARVAVGGVGTMPWRLPNVEAGLKGKPPTLEVFEAAAQSAVDGAEPLAHNGFKLTLLKSTIVRALAGLR